MGGEAGNRGGEGPGQVQGGGGEVMRHSEGLRGAAGLPEGVVGVEGERAGGDVLDDDGGTVLRNRGRYDLEERPKVLVEDDKESGEIYVSGRVSSRGDGAL